MKQLIPNSPTYTYKCFYNNYQFNNKDENY